MGKVTGFLEIEREQPTRRSVEERVQDWFEIYQPFPEEAVRTQAARCMDCGIPFCHTGCPVNNIIPDWNDFVYQDEWKDAIRVLHSTNNFPEFTGRICPAPCEAACVLGINEPPVAIKVIEKTIVEHAFHAWVRQYQILWHSRQFHPCLFCPYLGWFTTGSFRPQPFRARTERKLSEQRRRELTARRARRHLVETRTPDVQRDHRVGFHARGVSARPSVRLEIWAYGRRNPFLPWLGCDLAGLPLVKGRAVPLYWSAMDIAERLHLGGNPWRSAGNATPIEYPVAL